MKPIILALAAFTTTAAAQLSHALGACHEGAAIEGLCFLNETLADPATHYSTYYHNVSSGYNDSANAADTNGVLNWPLIIGGNISVSSAMEFSYNPGSNVVVMYFSPGYSTYSLVSFEPDGASGNSTDGGSMYISVSQDDTKSPITYYSPLRHLKNWYICTTSFGYTYNTLVWKIGVTGEPQNPTCVPVEVRRVWI
ncbi:hypothetical protein EJ02DRAFT_502211 [Clathrospora elynae]|uniref:DUF7907 domain-containing protein n=1 Tax=Clathrospora elynae TaxID=706981 RepID=A0A6A5SRS8_9PLEO|nr:hypothetical protein EJ02DRAFT_502211 [Clathrospora elynae]